MLIMRRGRPVLTLAVSILVLSACGGSTDQSPVSQLPTVATAPRDAPTIDYAADPEPSRSGDNTVSVQVRDKNGLPMPDLSVTVTYFMPTMPSMKMPEMKDSFVLPHKVDGKYSGTVRLSMGGTWTVTVVARKGEEIVAQRKLNIIAKD